MRRSSLPLRHHAHRSRPEHARVLADAGTSIGRREPLSSSTRADPRMAAPGGRAIGAPDVAGGARGHQISCARGPGGAGGARLQGGGTPPCDSVWSLPRGPTWLCHDPIERGHRLHVSASPRGAPRSASCSRALNRDKQLRMHTRFRARLIDGQNPDPFYLKTPRGVLSSRGVPRRCSAPRPRAGGPRFLHPEEYGGRPGAPRRSRRLAGRPGQGGDTIVAGWGRALSPGGQRRSSMSTARQSWSVRTSTSRAEVGRSRARARRVQDSLTGLANPGTFSRRRARRRAL